MLKRAFRACSGKQSGVRSLDQNTQEVKTNAVLIRKCKICVCFYVFESCSRQVLALEICACLALPNQNVCACVRACVPACVS